MVTTDGSEEELDKPMRMRATKKRVYARVPLTICPGIHLAVGVYNLVYPAKKPTAAHVMRDNTTAVVKTESRYLDAETGGVLDEHGIVKYVAFGGKRVFFSEADMQDIKSVTANSRGLVVLGYKPLAAIRAIDNLGPPTFLYPMEADVEGSTLVFRTLWQTLLSRRVAAICRFEARVKSAPVFVALIAQVRRHR